MTVVSGKSITCDVLIVGAGPVGLTTANLLGAMGVKTVVIDRESGVLEVPRAVGMCDEGSRVIHSLDLMADLEKEIQPVGEVVFMGKDSQPGIRVDTGSIVNGFQILRTIYQPGTERVLRKGVDRYANVELLREAELMQFIDCGGRVQSQVKVNTNSRAGIDSEAGASSSGGSGDRPAESICLNINSRFLLGCDGAGSVVRKMLGVELKGYTYRQDWLVIDVENDPMPIGSPLHFICDKKRPAVTLPTPNRTRRWEFVVKKGETHEHMCSAGTIDKLLKPWGDAAVMNVKRKTVYTFHALTADRFSKGNVFLMGDAAHLTPPFAGQGLMAGLRDASNIAWKLSKVLRGELPSSVLDTYHKERRPQAKIIIGLARMMGLLILPQSHIMAALRDGVFKMQKVSRGMKHEEESLELKKAPNSILGLKAILYWFRDPSTLAAGFELPFVEVEIPEKEKAPLDVVIQHQFVLLSQDPDLEGEIDEALKHKFSNVGGKYIALAEGSKLHDNGLIVDDFEKLLSKQLVGKKEVALIRPDRFVVFTCNKANINKRLKIYFDTLLEDEFEASLATEAA